MADERKPRRSDAPGPDLSHEREQFLKTFSKGAQLTREFMEEYENVQRSLQALEAENGRLRAVVEADDAIRDLIKKIEALELEKQELMSHRRRLEEVTTDFNNRFHE